MNNMNQQNWIAPSEQMPNDMQKIEFITKIGENPRRNISLIGKIEKGYFIQSENMFYGSFEDESDNFFFSWSVALWRPFEQ